MQAAQIFFSYSRADGAFALKLGEDLKKAGIDIWIDQIDIKPSTPWDEEIERALLESKCLLVILSKTSVASDNVLNEINYALESKKQVLPIIIEHDIKKPLNIIRLQHIDFTGSYEKGYALLLRSLTSGQSTNSHINRPSRWIIPIAVLAGVIIIAAILFKIYSERKGNADEYSLAKEHLTRKADSLKNEVVSLNGVWTTEEVTNPFDQFDNYIINFTLDASDSILLGHINFKSTVEYKGYHIKKGFLGGSIKGNNLSFYTLERNAGDEGTYKNYYNGIFLKDSIKFTLQSDRPGGFPGQRFVAKRTTEVR